MEITLEFVPKNQSVLLAMRVKFLAQGNNRWGLDS